MVGFQEPIPNIGLPCPALIQGEELSLTLTWYAHGRPAPFWTETEEEQIEECGEGMGREEERETGVGI